jgi:hypothetical protein
LTGHEVCILNPNVDLANKEGGNWYVSNFFN